MTEICSNVIHRESIQSDKWNIHISLENYSLTFAKFILAALISAQIVKDKDTNSYKLPLSDSDVERGFAFMEVLNNPSSWEEKISKLHGFSYPLLSNNSEERPGTTKWEDPLQSFLPVLFLQSDGNFTSARGATPSLSHLKYALKNNTFYEAYDKMDMFGGNLTK
jgi:hypothetical protein